MTTIPLLQKCGKFEQPQPQIHQRAVCKIKLSGKRLLSQSSSTEKSAPRHRLDRGRRRTRSRGLGLRLLPARWTLGKNKAVVHFEQILPAFQNLRELASRARKTDSANFRSNGAKTDTGCACVTVLDQMIVYETVICMKHQLVFVMMTIKVLFDITE